MDDTEKIKEKCSLPQFPAHLQRVLSRTIPGPISPQNKGALDWGWQGFLAYGAQTTVVVVDPVTLQCAQTLSKHRSHVVKVRWRKTRHYHQLSAPYTLTLASADINGTIIIWDVNTGDAVATLQDGNKPVQEMEWLGGVDGSEHLLAALHPPYSLVIWDTRHNTKLWKKSYTETLLSFDFDPFHSNKMSFLCGNCVLFVEDFSLSKCPSSNGRKFYVSTPRSSPGRSGSVSLPSSNSIDEQEGTSNRIKRKMKELVGEQKPKDDSSQLSDCLQLIYHRTVADELLLLYSREILILDLTINQTVGIIYLDRAMSAFTQVISCWQRDVLFCLHESGSVSAHFRRRLLPLPSTPDGKDKDTSWSGAGEDSNTGDHYYEVMYDRKCQSEPLRLNKNSRAIGMGVYPVSEKDIALVLGDGRVVFKEVMASPQPRHQNVSTPLFTPGAPTASHVISLQTSQSGLSISDNHFGINNMTGIKYPKTALSDMVKPAWALSDNLKFDKDFDHRVNVRILMTGLMPSVAPPPLVIRMCPPLTTRNLNQYVPLLAAGTHSGTIQIFNVATGMLEREFALHTYPVRGVEWTGLNSIISFGHQALTNSNGLVRNELIHTDTLTGRSITLRQHKSEESSIDMIKISYLKQYFIVVFREDPFELWDARKLVPLRTMPKRFPKVSALEWSPTSHVKSQRDLEAVRRPSESGDGFVEPNFATSPTLNQSLTESTLSLVDVGNDKSSIVKETFVFTDTEGQLYHFSVEGNVIKDGTKVPPDAQMSIITSIAWKSHEIVLSDSDGNLNIWDLKTRISRHIPTHRGWIRKIRFAPGRDNMKLLVLFADGADIWDVRDVVLVSQVKCPSDMVKIVDIDWGASDRPILATVDGCLKVTDMTLKTTHSPINQYCTQDPIVSPYLLKAEASLNLRALMTQQSWRQQYSLDFSEEDGFTEEQIKCINIWVSRIPPELKEFLVKCESTAHHALCTARLFGDQGEIDFWTVVAHYLSQQPSVGQPKEEGGSSNSSIISAEIINLSESASEKSADSEEPTTCPSGVLPPNHPLETSYHHLCDSYTFKHHVLERLAIHESKALEGEQRVKLGRSLAVIGERDRAVRLLLDADASNQEFYTDCLRACLLAATYHSSQAQSTIKLVATNLIAAGNIWEGVELLCLIGKAADACQYLQSYGFWESSVWLAKCALQPSQSQEILKRWAQHLISIGQNDYGVSALVSVGSIVGAIEQLVAQHYHQRAALLLHAAQQQQQQQSLSSTAAITTSSSTKDKSPTVVSNMTPPGSCSENIHRKYVLYLFSLGNRPAVAHFCHLMGEKGQVLQQELESLQ
ncbi:unnamed protein product, partial [Meganyctiphanes norvegica]